MSQTKRTVGLFSLVYVIALIGLTLSGIVYGVFPGTIGIAGYLVCPEGTVERVVVRDVSNPMPGTTEVRSTLHCLDESGCSTSADEWQTTGTLFGGACVAAALLILPFTFFGSLRKRGGPIDPRQADKGATNR